VSYIGGEGIGIGVVQRTESYAPGARFTRDHVVPTQERKYSIRREKITIHNVETSERAHMLAVSHALRLARRTIKAPYGTVQLNKITVFSNSEDTVRSINGHNGNSFETLNDIKSLKDRKMIKKVL
jgi:ribonuclease HI